jgi:hypothetical protein
MLRRVCRVGALMAAVASVAGCGPPKLPATDGGVPDAGSGDAGAADAGTPDASSSGVIVTGHAVYRSGGPVVGASVQIIDPLGPKPVVTTDAAGAFAVPTVTPPYSLSVVPGAPEATEGTSVTWEGVTRTDPTVLIHGQNTAPVGATCVSGNLSTITGTLTAPVGAGNQASVQFISPDSSLDPAGVVPPSSGTIPSGSTAFSVLVGFDFAACRSVLSGKVIYLEQATIGTAIVTYAVADLTVTAGVNSTVTLTPVPTVPGTLSGTVTFSKRPVSGEISVSAFFGIGPALFPLTQDHISASSGTSSPYGLPIVVIPGVDYRVLASADTGDESEWAWSDSLTGTATVNLTLPAPHVPVAPRGPVADGTPIFTSSAVGGAGLYVTLVRTASGSRWIGYAAAPAIQLPALTGMAKLIAGTYSWTSQALLLAGGPSVDQLLDGRMVRVFDGYGAINHPDFAAASVAQLRGTGFTVP